MIPTSNDPVNHPAHYNNIPGIECIKVVAVVMSSHPAFAMVRPKQRR